MFDHQAPPNQRLRHSVRLEHRVVGHARARDDQEVQCEGEQSKRDRSHESQQQVGCQLELLRRVCGHRLQLAPVVDLHDAWGLLHRSYRRLRAGGGCSHPDLVWPRSLVLAGGKRRDQRIAIEDDEISLFGVERREMVGDADDHGRDADAVDLDLDRLADGKPEPIQHLGRRQHRNGVSDVRAGPRDLPGDEARPEIKRKRTRPNLESHCQVTVARKLIGRQPRIDVLAAGGIGRKPKAGIEPRARTTDLFRERFDHVAIDGERAQAKVTGGHYSRDREVAKPQRGYDFARVGDQRCGELLPAVEVERAEIGMDRAAVGVVQVSSHDAPGVTAVDPDRKCLRSCRQVHSTCLLVGQPLDQVRQRRRREVRACVHDELE